MDNTDKMILDIIANRKKKKKRNIIIALSVFAALVIIGAFIPEDQKTSNKQNQASEVNRYRDYEIESRLKAEDIAKTHATNPDEAEFENQKVDISDNTYICTGFIISKNDFGVKKRAKYLIKLLHKDGNWELISESVFQ